MVSSESLPFGFHIRRAHAKTGCRLDLEFCLQNHLLPHSTWEVRSANMVRLSSVALFVEGSALAQGSGTVVEAHPVVLSVFVVGHLPVDFHGASAYSG